MPWNTENAAQQMQTFRCAGTLIVAAPFRDGLIVAADTCATLGNGQRYAKHKLLIPTRPRRTVLAILGTGVVYPAPPADTSNILQFLWGTRPFLNLEQVACAAFEAGAEELTPESFRNALAACEVAAAMALRERPELAAQLDNHDFFTLFAANFQSLTGASVIASCRALVENRALRIVDPEWCEFAQASAFETRFYGEADYVRQNVLPNLGLRYVGLAARTVAEIPQQAAEDAAVNLIELASQIAKENPPACGIAAPVDVVLVAEDNRATPLRWATFESP